MGSAWSHSPGRHSLVHGLCIIDSHRHNPCSNGVLTSLSHRRGLEKDKGPRRVPQGSVSDLGLDLMAAEPTAAIHGPPPHPDSSLLPVHLSRSPCWPPPGRPPGVLPPKEPLSDPRSWAVGAKLGPEPSLPLLTDGLVNLFSSNVTSTGIGQLMFPPQLTLLVGTKSHRTMRGLTPGANRKVSYFLC